MTQRQLTSSSCSVSTDGLRLRALVTVMAITVAATLLVPAPADAGTLYRWTEPDGALTFSPTPPTDGRSFEEVNTATLKPRTAAAPSVSSLPDAAATQELQAAVAQAPSTVVAEPVARIDRVAPTIAAASVERAVPTGNEMRIRADEPKIVVRAPTPQSSQTASPVAALNPVNVKAARCNDLRKRVTSLERRLSTPLSADDMDNTIVHMVRYQSSFDTHCG